ncbi:MAG: S-methyl-5'-thioadenosine phosphorylase [Coriobacteriia bacterium]|nr:S-methyl-5'-thioadenosine phosphorylase [Coriobacteriia bacterium]
MSNLNIPQVEVGVFGGTGFYDLLDSPKEYEIMTPFGPTSDKAMVGEIGGVTVGFVPRHGRAHKLTPANINYRANVWAMKMMGAKRVFGPCACGSLQAHVQPGDFVICDQFVDRTWGRDDSFFDGAATAADDPFFNRGVTHVSAADPYCPTMRELTVESGKNLGITTHDGGTIVIINGPRFSTRSESKWFASQGWEVINMTQYPEAYLARELEICYANISLITDLDSGVDAEEAVTNAAVLEVFAQNLDKLKNLLHDVIPRIPAERDCLCKDALGGSEMH